MSEYQRDIGRALAFLNEKPLLRAAALTAFDRGDADIIRQEEDGLLLRARSFPLVILCADSDRTALELLEALPACQLMQNERTELDEAISARYGFSWKTPVNNAVYEKKSPVAVDPGFEVRPLSMADYPLVRAHYSLIGDEALARHMARGDLLGGYAGDEMVGFIGRHDEGSLGMLYIFPRFRRRGYAWQLEGSLINRVLAGGERIFCQVILGNEASLALQRKLGMTVCGDVVSWLGK